MVRSENIYFDFLSPVTFSIAISVKKASFQMEAKKWSQTALRHLKHTDSGIGDIRKAILPRILNIV